MFKPLGKKLWDGWMWFAHKIGWVNEHILLGVVFFVFIGIYAILSWPFRLFTRQPKSLWRTFEHQPKTLSELERQF